MGTVYNMMLNLASKGPINVAKYTHRKKLCIIFSVTKSYKMSHFLSPDHTEILTAYIWMVCLDAAKIIEVRRISFLSYGGYKMP